MAKKKLGAGASENKVTSVVVLPRTEMRYTVFINGSTEKRSMTRDDAALFCCNILPSRSDDIQKSLFEYLPFIIHEGQFEELEETPPDPPKLGSLLFGREKGKKIKERLKPAKSVKDVLQTEFHMTSKLFSEEPIHSFGSAKGVL
jgi:hypothetical protein